MRIAVTKGMQRILKRNGLLFTNVGPFDRYVRVVLGILLLAFTVAGPQTAWGYVGLIPLITGVLGFCPIYALFKFSTCPTRSQLKRPVQEAE